MERIKRIGLLVGAFDPVHTAHIDFARRAAEKYDEIWLLPDLDKNRMYYASGEDRLEMCRLACGSEERIRVCKTMIRHRGDAEDAVSRLRKHHPGEMFYILDNGERESQDRLSKRIHSDIAEFRDPAELCPAVLRYIALHGLYLPDHQGTLTSMISAKRLKHTLGVRDTAVDMALKWGAPVIRAAVAAMLHDCAKGMPDKELLAAAEKWGVANSEDGMRSYPVLHGPVGACLARERFGVTDPEILNAITYHTVGRPGMTLPEVIIFVADAIEPGREDYPGLKQIREAAETDLYRAAYISIKGTYDYVVSAGRPFDPASFLTMKYLEARLAETEE